LNHQQYFGQKGETIAVHYLENMGYTVVLQNYRAETGEIDIIARDGDTLVFVEVKARNSVRFGSAKAAVDRRKQEKLTRTAWHYLKATNQGQVRARFDVVAITMTSGHPHVELVRNAFSPAF